MSDATQTTILIDRRETGLIGLLTSAATPANLILGDVQIMINNKLAIIIERKTISDLCASITDGRYNDQMVRLSQLALSDPSVRVVYLIECDDPSAALDNRILSCSTSFTLRGFSTIFVRNIEQSAHYINNLVSKIGDEKYTGGGGAADPKLAGKNKVCIKTPDDVYGVILRSIPGLSRGVIGEITKLYPTLRQLSLASEADLVKIKKVGKLTATKIVEITRAVFTE
jgi:ERCC4-type nuclease